MALADFATADLGDAFSSGGVAALPGLGSCGGACCATGPVCTLKLFEDNGLVRQMLPEPGHGALLLIDSKDSLRCAPLGEQLAGAIFTPSHFVYAGEDGMIVAAHLLL